MISRRTTLILSELFVTRFYSSYSQRSLRTYERETHYKVNVDRLYDFLFENEYPAWFCNLSKTTRNSSMDFNYATRNLKEFILRLHTGETIKVVSEGWNWDQRESYGHELLANLAEDLLNDPGRLNEDDQKELTANLELDGFSFYNTHLLPPESDILDTKEKEGAIVDLFKSLGLQSEDTAFHHLKLSEEHYLNRNWDDSISNSRKVLEVVLAEVAKKHNFQIRNCPLEESFVKKPVNIRDYLKNEGLIEEKEYNVLSSTYSLLSETGAHPYMAENDQARLLRSLALTLSQFIMLRLKGAMESLEEKE